MLKPGYIGTKERRALDRLPNSDFQFYLFIYLFSYVRELHVNRILQEPQIYMKNKCVAEWLQISWKIKGHGIFRGASRTLDAAS